MGESTSFNLADEPWICVRDEKGETREVSLLELFEQAPHIKCLANDLPTQDFAILRVLLAILQRSISPALDEDDDPAEVWGRLWEAPELPVDEIREYLNDWHGRFDLFDEERPFMQVAGLCWKETDGTESGSNLERIIADVPTREEKRLFSQRTGRAICKITFAEAARWLVHLQAFDVGSPGAPVMGEAADNVKMGKVYPGGMSWCGMLGCFYLEGASLRDTILLNFVPTMQGVEDDVFSDKDLPAWESEPLLVSNGHEETLPIGRAELFTWQSRWARLIADGEYVTDAVVSAGRRLKKDCSCLCQFESMTAWKISSKRGTQGFSPVRHSSSVGLWRGLASIFGDLESNGRICPPGVVDWARQMSGRDAGQKIGSDDKVQVHAVGLEYTDDPSNSSYVNAIDDKLELPSFLLTDEGKLFVSLAKECASSAAAAVLALGEFVDNLRLASGGRRSTDKSRKDAEKQACLRESAKKQGYYEVGLAFRRWLVDFRENSDAKAERDEWRKRVKNILRDVADDLIREFGPAAVAGAPVKDENGKTIGWMTASKAVALFNGRLRKLLPVEEDAGLKKEA